MEGPADRIGEPAPGIIEGRARPQRRVAFMLPGEGGQRPGMGRELYQAFEVFADALDEICELMAARSPWSVRGLLLGEEERPGIPDSDYALYTQDALFALQIALFRLFQEWEVRADFLVGHSVGEIAVATVAGVFSLDDAAAVMAERVRLVRELMPVGGAMVAIQASAEEAMASIGSEQARVGIAAINGPSSVVLSGDRPAVAQIARQWAERDRKVKELPVNRAFHSHHFDVLLPDFERFVAGVARSAPRIPIVSNLTGKLATAAEVCEAGYLPRLARSTSRFHECMQWLESAGVDTFVELSASGVLTALGRDCLRPEFAETALLVPALRGAGRSDEQSVLTAAAQLHANGVHVSWPGPRGPLGPCWAGSTPVRRSGQAVEPVTAGLPAERERSLLELVRAEVAAVLELPGLAQIEPETRFADLGFTSLAAVELADRLTRRVGIRIGAPLFFTYPSPLELTAELTRRLRPRSDAPQEAQRPAGPAVTADPIVLVGMSCRFPGGVRSPEDLWRVLTEERDVIGGFPANRSWDLDALYDPEPGRPGRSYVREGGFLPEAGEFDAAFFGISPVEALAMDPQQRLLLETAWEALERAGIDPSSLRGSRTGVFAGLMQGEYGAGTQADSAQADAAGAYLALGTSVSMATGRVAYTLGLEGPAVTVDTACSSSLVALHLAAQALRHHECDLALAGAAMVMTGPLPFIEFSRQRVLAPDARCKPFSAAADGTAWSEGAGMVVVERLSDARRHGHQVVAVLRGSAVNSDGASSGLTAPNGLAQQRVIRAALADAGLGPEDVDVVEAHGTGTMLGDPIEAEALLATYGRAHPAERPLLIGSAKSNLGHAQVAAGMAGLIKMALALRAGLVPATLHVNRPSPHVDWGSGNAEVVTRATPWPAAGTRRRAGVSAFGISGTNAHVVLEEPDVDDRAGPPPQVQPQVLLPWVLSARSEDALRAQASRLLSAVGESVTDLAGVGLSLGVSRTSFECRAVVVAGDRDGFTRGLARLASGTPASNVVRGHARRGHLQQRGGQPKTAFLFSGQGSQRPGMGRALYQAYPVFAGAFDELCEEFARAGVRDLAGLTFGEAPAAGELLNQTRYTQPALFAIEVALFRLLESWGPRPDYLLGHSVGEVAAAHVSGVLTVADACALVAARGGLMGSLPAGGAMMAVHATEAEVAARLPDLEGIVGIAAVNGPESVVISGEHDAVLNVAGFFRARGKKTARLQVSHAFHSPLIAPMLDDFRDGLENLSFAEPAIPVVSAVTGQLSGAAELACAEYWVGQARQPVRFADGIRCLHDLAVTSFVEIGPDDALSAMVRACLPDGDEASVVPVLRAGRPEEESALLALADLHVHGQDVDWPALFPGARRVDLPTYAFARRHYWLGARTQAGPAGRESVVRSWRYQVSWQPNGQAPNGRAPSGTATGHWLLITPPGSAAGDDHAAPLARGLAAGGGTVECIGVPATDSRREELAARLRARAPVSGVIYLAQSAARALSGWLVVMQAMGDAGLAAPLWTLTQGAVTADRTDGPPDPDTAALWGAARAAGLEHPGRWGGLIDLPPRPDERSVAHVLDILAGTSAEDQIAIRTGGVLVRRLSPAGQDGADAPAGAAANWAGASVLVTGATGALGGAVARWLAESGTGHVILASRRGASAPGIAALAADLARAGTMVTTAACDIADRAAVIRLLAAVPADFPLRAVFHAAGVPQNTPLDDITAGQVAEVMDAKATGASHLDELTAGLALDAFVLFSSIAGVWGSGRQTVYAAANAYLDALAERRRSRGGPATSIAWGPWAGGGMGAESAAERYLRARGLMAMPADLAIIALRQALERNETCVTVADVNWARFAGPFCSARSRPLIGDLPEVRRALGDPGPAPAGGSAREEERLHRELRELAGPERSRLVLELVRDQVARVLGHASAAEVDVDRTFSELGFGSLAAVELNSQLNALTGLRLPATVLFDHSTPALLARQLLTEILGSAAVTDASSEPHGTGGTPEPGPGHDPIAIIGMSCRFAGGARSPEDLWDLVSSGTDAISPFPDDRGWDTEAGYDSVFAGKTDAWEACFLRNAADFDAAFFGISPKEALAMDPQQRLLLEASWEAVERAGIDPMSLRGSSTGVFAGTNGQDYSGVLMRDPQQVEGYIGTATSASVMSGRVSYSLGLEGPAVTVDTACSASLVALHQAMQALRAGDCSLALVGGATVIASPWIFVEFSRHGALAADGRCKAFAAAADGTGWGEGVGMLLIERLSQARRNGHRVLAIVRGSAVNSDGASNGLTAPNGLAQQRVIRAALRSAAISADEVDAVEAHGTGTVLGDAIEAQALLATYGQQRGPGRPLWVGSVKSNIGHTQAAAGVAGIIKMVMAMRHGTLPRTLHADQPSPQFGWSADTVQLLTQARPWPETGAARRAGVASFGISGTNAHIILEQAPAQDDAPVESAAGEPADTGTAVLPWALSARSETALREQAIGLRSYLDRTQVRLADVGYSLARCRAAMDQRAVVVARGRDALEVGLKLVADGQDGPAVVRGSSSWRPGQLAVLFPGQGSQRAGMGSGLYRAYPVFAQAYDEVCEALGRAGLSGLADVISGDAEALDRTEYTQPALFAIEVALFRLLWSAGVRPDYLAGHSIGELTAAHVAGVLTLDDACTLVVARARLMRELPPGGAMVAIEAGEQDVRSGLAGLAGRVDIAALNAPSSTVISGDEDAVRQLADRFAAAGHKTKRLRVSHAFHSPRMEPMLARFREVAAGLSYAAPRIPVVSNVTGLLASADELTSPEYWVGHVRSPVRFADGIRRLEEAGVRTFLEAGPGAVLTAMGRDCVADLGPDSAVLVPALRDGRAEDETVVTALARLHVLGAPADLAALHPGGRPVDLPTYPFQHKRYWLVPSAAAQASLRPPPADIDTRFWEIVENDDAGALAAELGGHEDELRALLPSLSAWHKSRGVQQRVDSWAYRAGWSQLGDAPGPPRLTGTWLLAAPGDEPGQPATGTLAGPLAEALRRHGADVVLLSVSTSKEGRTELAARIIAPAGGFAGVLSLLATDERADGEHVPLTTGLAATVGLAQALGDADICAPLWVLTCGAVSTGAADHPVCPAQAQFWGLARTLAIEHSERWGGVIDLPAPLDAVTTRRVLQTLARDDDEDQVAVRPAGRYARRLARVPPGELVAGHDHAVAGRWGDGTVLITGGTGALGTVIARWAAGRGAGHVLLAGRQGAVAPGAAGLAAELAALGTRVSVLACDCAERSDVARLLTGIPETLPLRAVFHAAGVLDDGVFSALTAARFARVYRAKALGAQHLDELTRGADLDAFVLFSSVTATLGNAGQANYAGANAFLDGLAEQRRARGLAATSIAWGPWGQAGMAATEEMARRLRRGGVTALAPDLAVVALERALARGDTCVTIADIDWERLLPGYAVTRHSKLFDNLPEARSARPEHRGEAAASQQITEAGDLRGRLSGLPEPDRERALLDLVRGHAAAVLGYELDRGWRPFMEVGFDSLTLLELRKVLGAATGLRISATVTWDYPTPAALAGYLKSELFPQTPVPGPPILAEIDKLEAALSAGIPDQATHQAVASRLRALATQFGAGGDVPAPERPVGAAARPGTALIADPGQGDEPEEIQAATLNEMLDIVAKELQQAETELWQP